MGICVFSGFFRGSGYIINWSVSVVYRIRFFTISFFFSICKIVLCFFIIVSMFFINYIFLRVIGWDFCLIVIRGRICVNWSFKILFTIYVICENSINNVSVFFFRCIICAILILVIFIFLIFSFYWILGCFFKVIICV